MAVLALSFLQALSFCGAEAMLDCIYYIEYCNQVIDVAYMDGRMTWEDVKTEWARDSSVSV